MHREPTNTKQIGTATHAHKTTSTPPPAVAHVHTAALHTTTDSLLALEPRVMFDAAALLTGTEVSQDADPAHPTDATLSDTEHEQAEAAAVQGDSLREVVDAFGWPAERRELVFIDTSVDEYHTLMADITPNAEIILLDSTRDGIEQIAAILQDDTDIDAIHLLSHGKQGALRVGTGTLTIESMANEYAEALSSIRQALSAEADILIYGCRFGEGQVGQHAVTRLAQLTGADIAASQDLTGDTALGGDWELEYQTGSIETAIVVNEEAQHEFASVLGPTPPTIANLGGETLAYTEGDGAQLIDQSSNAAVTDVDNSDFETGTLTVSFTAGSDSTEDVLAIQHQGPGAGQIGIAGATVTYEGTTIGTVAGGSGGANLVITLDSDATPTAVSALVQNITYENTDTDDPTTGNRTVRYVLTDGDGGTSANYDTTVTVSAVNDAPTFHVGSFDISSASLAETLDIGSEDGLPYGLSFSPDGTKMFVLGNSSDSIYAYSLPAPFQLSVNGTEATLTQTLSIGSEEVRPLDFTFSSDGTKLFVIGNTDDAVVEYELSNSFDLTTATHSGDAEEFNVASQTGSPQTITFNQDGSKLFITNSNDDVFAYDLSTNFDVSTATYSDETVALSGPTGIRDLQFNNDGRKLFIVDSNAATIFEYDVGTAYELSTVVYAGIGETLDVSGNAANPRAMAFSADGSRLFVTDSDTDAIVSYNLDTVHSLGDMSTFIENGTAVVLDADVSIRDSELDALNSGNGNYSGASVTLARNGGANADDVLSFTDANGISLSGSTLLKNSQITATFDTTTAGQLVITWTDANGEIPTSSDVDNILRQLTYANTSDNPPASAQIDWTFTDGNTGSQGTGSALTATGSTMVSITAANDAPTFERGDGSVTTAIGSGDDIGQSVAVQADGKILVGGYTATANNPTSAEWDFALTRYNIDGSLDTSFGGGAGSVTTDLGSTNSDHSRSILVQADGKILLTGESYTGAARHVALVRYHSDGTLDTSFGGGDGIVQTIVGVLDLGEHVTLQSDGKILVTGSSFTGGSNTDVLLVRYLTDGTLDTSFGSGDGIVTTAIGGGLDSGHSVTTQTDGKILVWGEGNTGSKIDFALLRYHADGTLDTSFGGGDGIVTTAVSDGTRSDFGETVTVLSDGKILASGSLTTPGGVHDFVLLKYLADGTLDTSFGGGDGIVITTGSDTAEALDMVVQPDGKILLAGYGGNSIDKFAVARYLADGTVDTSFGDNGIVTTAITSNVDRAYSMALQADGKILLAGKSSTGSHNDFALVRYNSDGTLDTNFALEMTLNGTPTFIEDGTAVVLDADVSIRDSELDSLNGGTGNYSGASLTLARNGGANADDVLSFTDANGISLSGSTLLKNSQITATFDTTTAGQLVITWTDANGEIPTSSDVDNILRQLTYANTSDNPPASAQIDWTFTDGNTGSQGTGSALTATGSTMVSITAANDAPTFERGDGSVTTAIGSGDDIGQSVAVQADGKILVGGYTATANNPTSAEWDFALTRYNIDGSLDTSFGGGAGSVTTDLGSTNSDHSRSILVQADGKILLTGESYTGAARHVALVRYHSDGTLDTSFGGGDGIVQTIVGVLDLGEHVTLQSDGKILVTGSSFTGGSNTDVLLVRYLTDGTLDTSFGSGDGIVTTAIGGGLDSGHSVTTQTDGKILVWGEGNTGSKIDFALLRYHADGTLDTSFGGGDGIVTTAVSDGTRSDFGETVTVLSDGKILASGSLTTPGGVHDFVLLKYLADGTLDTSFGGGDGIVITTGSDTAEALDMVVQPDGKILLAGYGGNSIDKFAVARYLADGTVDTSFGDNGIVTTAITSNVDRAYSMALQADGKILLAGKSSTGSHNDFALVRYNSDGTLDTNFALEMTLNGTPTFIEDGTAVVLDADVSIRDSELDSLNGGTGNYSGASLTLARNGGANADDVLSFTDANGLSLSGSTLLKNSQIISSFDTTSSPGQLVITWTDANGEIPTSADVTAILRQLTYANSSETPPASAQIDWTFTDGNTGSQGTGGALTDSGSTTVTITAVNDVPVIDNLDGDTLAYTKSDGAVVIDQSSNATVIDVDSTNFETGTLTVSFTAGSDSAEDVLAIRHQGADAGQIGVSGPNVTYAGTMIGTVTGGTSGTNLVITFNSNAEATAVSALLNNITYANTDTENPTTSPRTVRYILTDGDGGTSATHDVLITVANPNSAPTITSNGGGALAHITVAESTTAVTTVTATDPDLPGDTFTYQLVGGADASHFVINSRTGALAFTTTPDFETPHDTNADNQYHVQVQVDDGHGGTDLQTMVVEVTNTMEPLPPMPEPEPEPEPETETEGEAEGESTTEDKQPTTMTSPTTTPPPPGPLSPVVLTQGPTPQDHPTDKSATAARVGREFDHQLAALSPRQVRDLTSAHRLGLSDTLSAPMRTFDLPYAAPRVSLELEQQLEALASHLHDTIQQDQLDSQIMSGVTAGTGLTLSAGYVAWMLRGTTILTSLFTSLPSWIHFDPLPILTGGYTAHKTGQETNGAAINQENKEHQGLDEIFRDSKED